jgi:hypothetical protein
MNNTEISLLYVLSILTRAVAIQVPAIDVYARRYVAISCWSNTGISRRC